MKYILHGNGQGPKLYKIIYSKYSGLVDFFLFLFSPIWFVNL